MSMPIGMGKNGGAVRAPQDHDTRICYGDLRPEPDSRDIQMWMIVLWQPNSEIHDEFLAWFKDEFAPGMLKNPELLRTRIFRLEHVSRIQDQEHKHVDKA